LEQLKISNLKILRKKERDKELDEKEERERIQNLQKEKSMGGYYSNNFKEDHMYSNKGLDLSKNINELEEDFM
jgi:hypothetical protein